MRPPFRPSAPGRFAQWLRLAAALTAVALCWTLGPLGSLTLPTLLRTDLVYSVGFARNEAGSFAIDNLFDRRNEQYAGFVAPGRRPRASVSLNH